MIRHLSDQVCVNYSLYVFFCTTSSTDRNTDYDIEYPVLNRDMLSLIDRVYLFWHYSTGPALRT